MVPVGFACSGSANPILAVQDHSALPETCRGNIIGIGLQRIFDSGWQVWGSLYCPGQCEFRASCKALVAQVSSIAVLDIKAGYWLTKITIIIGNEIRHQVVAGYTNEKLITS